MPTRTTVGTMLIFGASRGLGYAMVEQYLQRGWQVWATERQAGRSRLHDLALRAGGRLTIHTADITDQGQIEALRARAAGTTFDLLFVNAGVKNDDRETIADVSTEEFVRVLVTNALSPMRVLEAFRDVVATEGTIGVMSSGQGSVANNENGGYEVYRASKAALNTLMRSFRARYAADRRTMLLLAPGWVRTDMGGPQAHLDIRESIPRLVDTIAAQADKGGLHYLDYLGRTVPW